MASLRRIRVNRVLGKESEADGKRVPPVHLQVDREGVWTAEPPKRPTTNLSIYLLWLEGLVRQMAAQLMEQRAESRKPQQAKEATSAAQQTLPEDIKKQLAEYRAVQSYSLNLARLTAVLSRIVGGVSDPTVKFTCSDSGTSMHARFESSTLSINYCLGDVSRMIVDTNDSAEVQIVGQVIELNGEGLPTDDGLYRLLELTRATTREHYLKVLDIFGGDSQYIINLYGKQ